MDVVKGVSVYEIVILAIIGVLLLVCGYRIKKVAFFIIWFLLGYQLVVFLMPTLNNMVPQIAENNLWQALLPVAGGLLLALLGFSIEKLCVGGICFALVMIITVQYFGAEIQTIAIGAIVGVIAAGAAVTLMKPAIIVATAAAGGYALTLVILTLASQISPETFYWPILIGLTAVGSAIQFTTTKRIV